MEQKTLASVKSVKELFTEQGFDVKLLEDQTESVSKFKLYTSTKLCDREEVRKETAKEILLLLGKGFDETARKDFKDLQWYKQFCRELELRYGIELLGKTEQVENFDKLDTPN